MTQLNKPALTLLFQQGDVPTGTDYANLIDSQVNVAGTAVQTMQGPLNPTELITARVSATDINVTGSLTTGSFTFTGNFSAASINTAALTATTVSAGTYTGTTIRITGDVTAKAVNASAGRFVSGVYQGTGTVSAAGTTQGAAAILTNIINRGKGVADGVTTGFAPLANRAGLVQYLLNEGPSANLWPPTGGFINGLAVNTPFALAASAAFTIFHITASSYGVK